jgi:hypothetical protein
MPYSTSVRSLEKVAHSHIRPFSGQYRIGLTNRRELTQTRPETFHPFTQENDKPTETGLQRNYIFLTS